MWRRVPRRHLLCSSWGSAGACGSPGLDQCCAGHARSLDNSECAFRSEDFAPNRFAYQREATSVLITGARLRGAGGTAGPGAPGAGGPCGAAPRCAVVLAGGLPRVLVAPGQADHAALAALSAVEPDERGGGFLGGLRLAAVRLRLLAPLNCSRLSHVGRRLAAAVSAGGGARKGMVGPKQPAPAAPHTPYGDGQPTCNACAPSAYCVMLVTC